MIWHPSELKLPFSWDPVNWSWIDELKKKSQKLSFMRNLSLLAMEHSESLLEHPSAIIKHIQLHTKDTHWIAAAILTNSTKDASNPASRIFPIYCPQDSEARCPPINLWLNFREAPQMPLSLDFGICPLGHTWLKFSWFQSSQKPPPLMSDQIPHLPPVLQVISDHPCLSFTRILLIYLTEISPNLDIFSWFFIQWSPPFLVTFPFAHVIYGIEFYPEVSVACCDTSWIKWFF